MGLFNLLLPRRRRGAGLAGLCLLGAYLLAMWSWNADIARQAATRDLRQRIVRWVDQQTIQPGGYSWDDLRRAGVVTEEDARLLHKQRFQYQRIGPDSPPDAILFLHIKDANEQGYVYKDGGSGYQQQWPASGGNVTLADLPGIDHRKTTQRTVQFLRNNPPAVLGEFAIDGYQRQVLWNRPGNLVAMNASLAGEDQPFTVWRLKNGGIEVVPLPENLSIEWLLSQETRHADAKWGMETIEARTWHSDEHLLVFVNATGSYVDPATNAKMGFNLIYDVLLDASGNACRIKSLSKRHFAASAFR